MKNSPRTRRPSRSWPQNLNARATGELPADWKAKSAAFVAKNNTDAKGTSTRKASLACIEAYSPALPELIGGSADLGCSNLTEWSGHEAHGQ